jgi:NADPH-dependent curcumin reductase CurA
MQGFIVFDYANEYPTALAQLAQWIAEGKLKGRETIIKGGIAAADEAFKQLFQGGNIGK